MDAALSRRKMIQAVGVTTMLAPFSYGKSVPELASEGSNTPKISMAVGASRLSAGGLDEAGMRRVKQLGVHHVLMGGPRIPWEEREIKSIMDRLKSGGLTLGNMMIAGFSNTIYGRPGRDEEIDKVRQSIRAAGRAGLPVVEYNFYAHRSVEGYYEESGRAGAGLTAFDYVRVKDLLLFPTRAPTAWRRCGAT